MKLPAFQFYPGDWRKDPAVQSLSYAERGIWIEMLCLMHESNQPGKLMIGGMPYPEDRLARTLGLMPEVMAEVIHNLITLGVATRCPDTNSLMSPRMVRDRESIQKRADCGKLGGNPNFQKGKPNPYKLGDKLSDNLDHKVGDNQKITPSSSSSISSSISISDKTVGQHAAGAAPTSDADWLESLKVDPAYVGIDVGTEHAKASRWCETNRKQLSRRRFINWLNRAERPIGSAKPQGEFANAW